jgi:hypothetical protein
MAPMLSVSCRIFPEIFLSSDITSLPSVKPDHQNFPSIQIFKTAHYPKQPDLKNQEANSHGQETGVIPVQVFDAHNKKKASPT